MLGKEITEELEDAGYQMYWAKNAEEAFVILDNNELGLVYLDIMLPGETDGFGILAHIKQDERLKHLPVVMLSNLGEMKEIDKALSMGATDYIVKARIDLDKLLELTESKFLLGN